jgi:hypothetical protein
MIVIMPSDACSIEDDPFSRKRLADTDMSPIGRMIESNEKQRQTTLRALVLLLYIVTKTCL